MHVIWHAKIIHRKIHLCQYYLIAVCQCTRVANSAWPFEGTRCGGLTRTTVPQILTPLCIECDTLVNGLGQHMRDDDDDEKEYRRHAPGRSVKSAVVSLSG